MESSEGRERKAWREALATRACLMAGRSEASMTATGEEDDKTSGSSNHSGLMVVLIAFEMVTMVILPLEVLLLLMRSWSATSGPHFSTYKCCTIL